VISGCFVLHPQVCFGLIKKYSFSAQCVPWFTFHLTAHLLPFITYVFISGLCRHRSSAIRAYLVGNAHKDTIPLKVFW
jgi:hypothetical protein